MVEGKLQVEGDVIHVVANRCFNLNGLLRKLTGHEDDALLTTTLSHSDETTAPYAYDPRQQTPKPAEDLFHKGRNFK